MQPSLNVFLIDSDERQMAALKKSLVSDYKVQTFNSIDKAMQKAKESKPEMIISELEFDKADALEYIMDLRSFSQSHTYKPLIAIYTEVSDHFAQVAVYNAGADAYWVKHQTSSLIKKKLDALKRRLHAVRSEEIIRVGNLEINKGSHLVTLNGVRHTLAKKEFEMLEFLAKNPKRVVSREELRQVLWNSAEEEVKLRTIDVHIRKIRIRLGEGVISTIVGEGYKIQS